MWRRTIVPRFGAIIHFNARREGVFSPTRLPATYWTEITKSHPSRLSEKGFKLLDLFTVQQQQVHKLRVQF
jgi:threonine synthase